MRTRNHLANRKLLQTKDSGLWAGLLLLCCLIVAASARATAVYGQSYQGGLRGAVHDATGAVIAGTQLTLTNEETNAVRSTVSNSDGEYSFANVLPGTYAMTATQTGFKKADHKGIRIGTQSFITLDVTMEVGAATEEVTISGGGPLLENSNASVSSSPVSYTHLTLPTIYSV